MKKVYAKEELCLNCHLCEVFCKTAHSLSKDVIKANKYEQPAPAARVKVYGDNKLSVAVNCRHCEEPKCVKACITGAMTKDKKTGIVSVNEEKCIGCMTCLAVCPFGCIQTGKFAVKCDLCRGEDEPACVKNCPNRALVYTDLGGAEV
ncbi:MAG: 4Fe-4S dicluster domain-containing protein [Clostridia bacterium]|nr:4Fe-4S dicluster domain-containing protein [Clostridia bacterium]